MLFEVPIIYLICPVGSFKYMTPKIPGMVSAENIDYYWERTEFPKRDYR